MEQEFIEQIKGFRQLITKITESGVRKKVIADYLGIYPSAFSSLTNSIISELLASKNQPITTQKISKAFGKVNNVSEKRIRQEIAQYNKKLEMLMEEVAAKGIPAQETYVNELLNNTPESITKMLIGTFDCYYISSFGYRVKKEPFMIRSVKGGKFPTVLKGNNKSPACFKGFLYISNNHLFTVQLQEIGTVNPDNFIAHFILPPSYSESLNIFRGVSLSMSNSFFPIARKVLLNKRSSDTNLNQYQEIETEWYTDEEAVENSKIGAYLCQANALMEYIPIPQPAFDEDDLQKELEITKLLGI